MKPKLYKPPSVLPLIKRIGRVSFKPVAIAVVSLSVIGVLVTSVPYVWNLPKEEVTVLLKEPTVKGQTSPKEKAELIDKYRSTLISGIGTLATIFGAVVLIRNVDLAVKKLKQDADKNKVDKDLAESRLISERFSKSIEQIGSEIIHIRLGGIYSLEKIARDSPKDQWTVMEVLSAFIREESPYELKEASSIEEDMKLPKVSVDVQAALTVIGRRKVDNKNIQKLDLSKTNLNHANLQQANLTGSILRETNLFYADLRDAVLIGSDLRSEMRFADLSGADLRQAILSGTDLSGATLAKSDLSNANLSGTKLLGAKLYNAKLGGASLNNADFFRASLNDTDLSGVDIKDAKNITYNQIYNESSKRNAPSIEDIIAISKNDQNIQPP
jgi:uncharacterized protein YjbI with pentapeptide repeats